MSGNENSLLISRLRKRKVISYKEMDSRASFNLTGSADDIFYKETDDSFNSMGSTDEGSQKRVTKKKIDEALIIDENKNGLSEYELIRLKNIEERKRLFCELNLDDAKHGFQAVSNVKKEIKPVPRKFKKTSPLPPRQKSLRLQNKSTSGEPLPEKKLSINNVVLSALDYGVARKPSGPLPMAETATNEVDSNEIKKYMECFEFDIKKQLNYAPENKLSGDLERFVKNLSWMTLSADHVVKVVPHRIYSMAVHPSESYTLLAAGDKWGHLGLWNLQSKEIKNIQVFQPHSGPVNCTNFCIYNPVKIYSTSHDGTVRCGDMNRLVFDEIYSSDEDMAKNHTTWHCQTEECCLLVAHGNGDVALVDSRTPSRTEGWYSCHERSVRTVQLDPLENQHFITSSSVCEVKVWDRRYLNKKSPEPVYTLTHPKGLTSAFFSPSGRHILTTCNDDRLRVYDAKDTTTRPNILANISHNTHTGQWLTTFKATWHPQRDDLFVVGSMEHPRRILLYSSEGKRVFKLQAENLASICSICLFHPTQNIIFGGNSSGRVHVFM